MSEIKWIKITTDIFENRKIRQIESLPDGDAIIVIWLKLLTLAGNINDQGLVYFTSEIPYTEEMMATQFNRPLSTVKLALKVFVEFGMIDIVDDILKISNWEKYQNVDGLDRIREQTRKRVAKHREKQRELMESRICQYCGGKATGYDHILATSKGGTDKDENKVPCCIECNRIKNDRPVVDFLNNNRERINDEIVTANEKLKKFVTLCNVTDCYTVTDCNATEEEEDKDIDIDKDKDIDIDIDKDIDIDIDKDIDIDIDKDKEKYKKKNAKATATADACCSTPKKIKHKYGEYKNVLLTDEEFEKLVAEFSDLEQRIDNLSGYIASTGKAYKSHYATIRNWARKEKEAGEPVIKENGFANFEQRAYDEDLEKILLSRRK